MLLGTLGASSLTVRGMYRAANQGQGLFRAGQGVKKMIDTFSSFNKLGNTRLF